MVLRCTADACHTRGNRVKASGLDTLSALGCARQRFRFRFQAIFSTSVDYVFALFITRMLARCSGVTIYLRCEAVDPCTARQVADDVQDAVGYERLPSGCVLKGPRTRIRQGKSADDDVTRVHDQAHLRVIIQ